MTTIKLILEFWAVAKMETNSHKHAYPIKGRQTIRKGNTLLTKYLKWTPRSRENTMKILCHETHHKTRQCKWFIKKWYFISILGNTGKGSGCMSRNKMELLFDWNHWLCRWTLICNVHVFSYHILWSITSFFGGSLYKMAFDQARLSFA